MIFQRGREKPPVIKMPPAWPFQQDGIWRQMATERTMMLCIHRKAKLVGLVGRKQGRMSFRIVHFFGLTWVEDQGFWWILQKWNLDHADILFWSLSSPGPVTLGDVRKSLNLLYTRLNTRILRHRVESLTYLSLLPEDIVTWCSWISNKRVVLNLRMGW